MKTLSGKPTPEFHYGFKTSVVATAEVDAKNAPLNYTVTWTAKTAGHAIDDGTSKAATADTEYGPAPTVTTVAAVAK